MRGLKQMWPALSDDDIHRFDASLEEFVGLIQQRTGESRESVESTIREYCSALAG